FPHPLSAKEEHDGFDLMKDGDFEARDKLIRHNLRIVAHVIKKYYSSQNDQDDMISIGTIGLIKAVNTFNYCKGARFATYAARCIENEILMQFRSNRKTQNTIYINDPLDTDAEGNSLTILDILSDSEDIAENLELKLDIRHLRTCIDKALFGRERKIIDMRYGLAGELPLTQQEVADLLGISRSYVSRLEKKAIDRLRTE
ncbi:MAG: RNA polymerase sporulation sigma factor SigK, partial [Oscillospiraceae bacterium]